jgi:membrane protein YdbS with pleckstrin-like domain
MSQIILFVVIHSIVFGIAGYFIGDQREIGAIAGGFLCLVLGIIGLVIVLVSRRKQVLPFNMQLLRCKDLLDKGIITNAEYNHLKGRLIEQQ